MIGTKISHYTILEKLGEGGMGAVYLAEDSKLERRVALKVLPMEVAGDPDRLARFEREAKAVAALNHPNIVTVHSIERDGDLRYITMELVEGKPLSSLIPPGGLDLERFFELAVPLANALAAAHKRGITHRDLKPANIMVTEEDRQVKVLDFGLAKFQSTPDQPEGSLQSLATLPAETELTQRGAIMGTVPYMSPEQIESRPVDPRSDIFSLGIVLHEMATGGRPFHGDSGPALVSSILKDKPKLVTELKEDLPRQLGRIVRHCLKKNPSERFQTALDVHNELESLRREVDSGVQFATGPEIEIAVSAEPKRGHRNAWIGVAATALVVAAGSIWYAIASRQKVERARVLAPEIERLAQAGDYVAAYELALQVEEHLPEDPVLAEWMPEISDVLTVSSQPPGSNVFLRRLPVDDQEPSPARLGSTPLESIRIARADYHMSLEKEGFVPREQVVSSAFSRTQASRWGGEFDIEVNETLQPVEVAPDDMVFVPGGRYKLRGRAFTLMPPVVLADFWIDRYEVTNERYREFIRAGGYSERSFWKQPFLDEGQEIPFKEAIGSFTDRTGLPGPREWSGQEFPEGRGSHPVTGISWYEAAAFAEYEGKSLPTVYQWENSARGGRITQFEGLILPWGLMSAEGSIQRRANYVGRGTQPVDSYPFGISPVGAYNMAGNVAEWTLNKRGSGRAIAGGSWADTFYQFGEDGSLPPMAATPTVGFRCVSQTPAEAGDQGTARVESRRSRAPLAPAVDDATYRGFLSHYRYDKRPLEVEVLETIDGPDWRREKLRLPGSSPEDPILAYLYLPKRSEPPYQLIYWVVSATVAGGRTAAAEVEAILAPQIKGGRAVMSVVPPYGTERSTPPPPEGGATPVWRRNAQIQYVTEFRIGLDYLETREEIDMSRIAHAGFSWGALGSALILDAVDPRFSAYIYIGGALNDYGRLPEVNPVNFVPRIQGPTLVLSGKYDEQEPYEPFGRYLYERLPGPKRLELVDSGHLPPVEIRTPIINGFLDEILGPVG